MPELNPLFVKCAMRELALTGFSRAEFDELLAVIRPDPREPNLVMNDRVVRNFGQQIFPGDVSMDELETLRQRCEQMTGTYMAADSIAVAKNQTDKLLAVFCDSALTAHEVEDGISYSVWEYDPSQTWFPFLNPQVTRDYAQAKRMFCFQSGMLAPSQFDIRLSEAEMERLDFDLGFHGIATTAQNGPGYAKSFEIMLGVLNDSIRRQAGTLATGHGLTLQHLAMLGASNFRLKIWGDDPSSPAVIPTLTSETLTPAGLEEWRDVLSASVTAISGPRLDDEIGPTVTLCEQADGQRVLDFGNLLAGNCTQEQQASWVQHSATPANGYEWPSLRDEQYRQGPGMDQSQQYEPEMTM